MVNGKTAEKGQKEEVRKRRASSSSSSTESSSDSSETSSFTDSSSSGTTTTSESSRSPTPKKVAKERGRSPGRRSRSPRGAARPDRSEKATIASSRRSPSPERHRRRLSPSPKHRPSPSPKRRADRSGSREKRNRSRSRERKVSPVRKVTPPPRRLCVRNLSRNVTKEHLAEIFSVYGTLKTCELPMDRQHTHLGRGYGYVEFEQPEDAEKALKHMDGGQIDGQEVTCELTHPPRSVINGSGRRALSPLRYRGGSPRRYRSPPPPRGRASGGNLVPLGPSRFNRSRSRSLRRRRSRS